MKKCLIALMLVLGLAVTATAATQNFSKFSIDVPEGWTATQDGITVAIVANDNSAALSITTDGADGMSEKDLAAMFAKELKGTAPQPESGMHAFTFNSANGVGSKCFLVVKDDKYALFVLTGTSDKFGPMMGSLKDK